MLSATDPDVEAAVLTVLEWAETMIRTAIIKSLLLRGLRHKKANNILTLHLHDSSIKKFRADRNV